MRQVRRNTITRADALVVAAIAASAAVAAVLSPAEPTGGEIADAVLTGGVAALVTWLAASAPWWALMVASGLALFGAAPGTWVWIVLALAALGAGAWIGINRLNEPWLRAGVAAVAIQVLLRLEWDPFFGSSALVAGAAMVVVAFTGYRRRKRYVRRRVFWGTVAAGVLAVLSVAGLGVAAAGSAESARDGYDGMLEGLDLIREGEPLAASAVLRDAAADLDVAAGDLDGPLSQGSRLIPGLAQNRNAAVDIIGSGANTAAAAADALASTDLERLTVVGGRVNVEALADLAEPVAALEDAVGELAAVLDDAQSPWLVAPLQDRLDAALTEARRAEHQARATAAAGRVGPAMLGADGPRRYFVAFVNAAEARGHSGLMGNWNEVTIDDGQIEVTATGRTARLQTEDLLDLRLDMPADYLNRYGIYGARIDEGVDPKFWSNVTMPPDGPSVGDPIAQMYEAVNDVEIDGVLVIDAAGLAALLDVSGPIEVPGVDLRLDSGSLEQFLLVDQYEFEEAEREQILDAITQATIASVLGGELPAPQRMAPVLAPAAQHGHITGWAARPEEQELFELIGMDAGLPSVERDGADGLAVVTQNSSGNKIESFLQRTIEYLPVVDESTGEATARLRVRMTNNAPETGLPDYVIGNIVGAPPGTSRMLLDVYTKLPVDAVSIDGERVDATTNVDELGYHVTQRQIDLASGETVTIEYTLSGDLGAGVYHLYYRPQPLPAVDTLVVDARTNTGEQIFAVSEQLERRSVITRDGIEAAR